MPNVVDFYGAFQDDRYFYIIMEYCPGGDLLEHLLRDRKAMSERRAALEVARPLLTTLASLHTLNIIHRDIKLENIFMDATGRVRLGDFGLTMSMQQEAAISPVGTVEYMAPEVVALPPVDMVTSGRVRASSITPNNEKVDIWALGVTLFELVTGKLPFEGKDKSEIKAAITAYNLASFPSYISASCQAMIRSMLAYDHKDRPSAEQLLQHPYLLAFAQAGRGSPGPVVALHARAGLLTVPNVSVMDPLHASSKAVRVSQTNQWSARTEGTTHGSPTQATLASSFPPMAMSASSREVSASNLAPGSTQRWTSGSAPGPGVHVAAAAAKAGSGAWAALRRISAGHKPISAYSAPVPAPMEEESSSDSEQGNGVKRVIRRLFSRQSAPHRMDVDTVAGGTKVGMVGEGTVRASLMN